MKSLIKHPIAIALLLAATGCATTAPRPTTPAEKTPTTTEATPAPARNKPQRAGGDLARFVAWMQQAQAAYNLLLDATGDYQNIDIVSTAVLQKKLKVGAAVKQVQAHIASFKSKLQRYEHVAARLTIPQVGAGELTAEMHQLAAYLGTLREQVKQGFGQSVALFERVRQGKHVNVTQFATRRLEHYIAMLEAENAMMRASSVLSSIEHPQRQLQKTVVASNLAVISILRGYRDRFEATGTPPAIFIQEGQTNLEAARSAIARGRKLTTLMVIRLNTQVMGRTLNPKARSTMVNAMKTYTESFQVEERIVKAIDASLETLETGAQPTVLAAVEPLVQRRMALQQQRQAMFRSIAEELR